MAKWMDARRLRRAAALPLAGLLAAAAVALATGCGSSDDPGTPSRTVVQVQHVKRDRWTYARERFNELCAGCHTLKDSGARGRRFNLDNDPNIDEARARYAIAEGEPGMPAWREALSKREYEELVAYVDAVSGTSEGPDNWSWQIALREEGNAWEPEDPR
jgi:mono/diheme cytochrome c family protein